MSVGGDGRSRFGHAIWLVAILALIAVGLATSYVGALLAEAAATVKPLAVVATLPGQAASMLICGAALYALRPGVSYRGCLGSRMLRDSVSNLVALFPGAGEAVGARALVLAGGRSMAAVTASALDKLAESVAQLPYIGLAAFILLRNWDRWTLGSPAFRPPPTDVLLAFALLAAIAALAAWLARARSGWAARIAALLKENWRLVAAEFHAQKSGFPLSTMLHFVAWSTSGVQIWMAAMALGIDLTLFEAITLASTAFALRGILFFVPAGLVLQEAGLVAAGLVFGVPAPQSLALGLVLRLRDLLFGLPLLLWPAFEIRHGRKAGGGQAH